MTDAEFRVHVAQLAASIGPVSAAVMLLDCASALLRGPEASVSNVLRALRDRLKPRCETKP
jgi:hypothetical protein